MKNYLFGLIGCGHMGMCIAKGAILKSFYKPEEIIVYDPSPAVQEECKKQGFALANNEVEVTERASLVMLGVRPQDSQEVLEKLQGTSIETLVSIVTGISISYLEKYLGNVPIIRAMPNTPLQVNHGATTFCTNSYVSKEVFDKVNALFSSMGITAVIEEKHMNEMVSLHGSTPAYFYLYLKYMIQDMVKRGLDPRMVRDFMVETMIGSGELLKANPNRSLDDFIQEVCSPGGTTFEAIDYLKNQDLEQLIEVANYKCIKRADELSK